MTRSRLRWAAAALALGLSLVVTGPSSGATASAAQIQAAERTLVVVASADDPAISASEASSAAQIATMWPSNVAKVEYQLADRAAAPTSRRSGRLSSTYRLIDGAAAERLAH